MKICILKNEDLSKLSKIVLKKNQVHIWVVSCKNLNYKNLNYWISNKKDILKRDELKIAKSFRYSEDRIRYMTGRILTRMLSAHYLQRDIREINIEKGTYGKPFIICNAGEKLHYNLSHSGEYVTLAFTFIGKVGVDIEEEKELQDYKNIAKNFHEREYCKVNSLHEFYKLWTSKEAYLKALGLGLQKSLKSFYICENKIYANDIWQDKDHENGILDNEENRNYELYTFENIKGYPLALVINKV